MTYPEDTPYDAVPPDGTHRLRPQHHAAPPSSDTSTVQLGGGHGSGYGTPMPAYEATPTVFVPTPAPGAEAPAESLIRFGPGVPDPQTARTMAVWQGAGPAGAGTAAESGAGVRTRKRKLGGFVLAGIVLLLVVGYLLWNHFGTPLKISSVSVSASPAALACDATEVVTATVGTNGSPGTIHYRWVRSDGTTSGALTQTVPSGTHQVSLPLRWTVQGQGNLQGTATVEISDPGTHTASGTFNYSCTKSS